MTAKRTTLLQRLGPHLKFEWCGLTCLTLPNFKEPLKHPSSLCCWDRLTPCGSFSICTCTYRNYASRLVYASWVRLWTLGYWLPIWAPFGFQKKKKKITNYLLCLCKTNGLRAWNPKAAVCLCCPFWACFASLSNSNSCTMSEGKSVRDLRGKW